MFKSLLSASLIMISTTASAYVSDQTRLHDLKQSELAGNLLGPSGLGSADVIQFKNAVVINAELKEKISTVKISPSCELSIEATSKSRLIKEGSSYGLFSLRHFQEDTILPGYKRNIIRMHLANAFYELNKTSQLFIECKGMKLESTVAELKAALNNKINVD